MGASLGGNGGGRRGRRGQNGGFSEINVTPFVDVMLVLLIIFMVAAPMMTAGVQVDLPESAASPISGQDEPLTITVQHSGVVYIQETAVPTEELGAKLAAILQEKKDTRIFVKGDTKVSYGTMMQVVGEINAAGFTKVALLTVPGK